MLGKREAIGWFTLATIFTLSLTLPGAAAELQRSAMPVAHLDVAPLRIDWFTQVDHERLVLSVSGPGDLFIRRVFEGGQAPSLGLFDLEGDRLPDGSYTWELRWVEKSSKAREASEKGDSKNLQVTGKAPERPPVLSGHFSVRGGSFAAMPSHTAAHPPKPPVPTITAKNLIESGNLIVQGKACIGDKCATNDANFSALKLKSTLPNLLFDDVDIPCEDPPCTETAHDWAILINPSDVAQFSVRDVDGELTPFTVAAGAPDNSLYVGGNGNVGLGTSTPAVRLDVQANATGQAAARLQNSSSSGYSAIEYLDNAGNVDLFFGIDNAASTTRLNSVNSNPIVILTNSAERMRVTSSGDIGIGTTSPASRLDIRADASNTDVVRITNTNAAGFPGIDYLDETGATGLYFGLDNAANTTRLNSINNNPIVILTNSTERIRVTSGGNVGIGTTSPTHPLEMASGANVTTGGVWTNASSRELKRDIHSLGTEEALSALAGLEPVRFRYKADPDDEWLGFIAEEVPDLVATADRKTLSPMDLTAVLTKVVQEQQKAIVDLRATVASLSGKLAAMEERKENNR